jgi:hypothetical protein
VNGSCHGQYLTGGVASKDVSLFFTFFLDVRW